MELQKLTKKIKKYGKPLHSFKPGYKIYVNDKMQSQYSYTLSEPYGKNFRSDFKPALSPGEILFLGAFEGKYMNDCYKEFPKYWYTKSLQAKKLSPDKPDASINHFKIKSRLSLQEWIRRKWIPIIPGDKDVRGWFQWYCRYYIGRRMPSVDDKQINRWKSFKRHVGQVEKNCKKKDKKCRPKQRQALLQWAYDPFI